MARSASEPQCPVRSVAFDHVLAHGVLDALDVPLLKTPFRDTSPTYRDGIKSSFLDIYGARNSVSSSERTHRVECMKQVIIVGGTGYIGKPLIEKLSADGFCVTAVARPRSSAKLPVGCAVITGNALDSRTYEDQVLPGSTFVHLVGTPHPAPWKGSEFRSIDLVSLEQSVAAARRARVDHFVFVSVAHPAPVMKAFIEIRIECERIIQKSGLTATILRPWYVLSPGHYWPYLLVPFYRALEALPATKESAMRLGMITRPQMVNALAAVVASRVTGVSILETAEIRSLGTTHQAAAPAWFWRPSGSRVSKGCGSRTEGMLQ